MYWSTGRSTTGSISLGMARVAGSSRVPSPATGTTASAIAGPRRVPGSGGSGDPAWKQAQATLRASPVSGARSSAVR